MPRWAMRRNQPYRYSLTSTASINGCLAQRMTAFTTFSVGVPTGSRCSAAIQADIGAQRSLRSEEHTSELQSLMRISYAVFCLKKKTNKTRTNRTTHNHEQH